MKTLTIDIIDDKAIKLLEDLEMLHLIRVRKEELKPVPKNWADRYKGAMSKQPLAQIENQLNELRN